MGASIAPAPLDYRVERTVKKFSLPPAKVEQLWKIFCKFDREGNGYMTMDDFFDNLLGYPRTGLTDTMFKLIESSSGVTMTFGEFVEVVATFSCFEKKELLRYFFYVLDNRHTGLIEKTELKHFIEAMWEHDVSSNVRDGLAYLDRIDDGDGAFNFAQIESMELRYPIVFYPLYRLQVHVIHHTLGESWWEAHKANLADAKADRLARTKRDLLQKEKQEMKDKEIVSDEMIQQRMGFFKYHLMPWLRAKEKGRILKIAALEVQLERTVIHQR